MIGSLTCCIETKAVGMTLIKSYFQNFKMAFLIFGISTMLLFLFRHFCCIIFSYVSFYHVWSTVLVFIQSEPYSRDYIANTK